MTGDEPTVDSELLTLVATAISAQDRLRFAYRSDRSGESERLVEPLGGGCRIRMVADTLDWLAFRLIRLGADFVVEEPPELIEHLSLLGARLTRAAGGRAS